MKEVGLWQVDGKFPNLALMKLACWLRQRGETPVLQQVPDEQTRFASVIFTWHKPEVEFWKRAYPQMEIGGSGFSLKKKLPAEVETCPSDYSLFGIDYGLGFLSRGCIRRCPFCIVPEKEGKLRRVHTISELINPKSKRLILLDNNLLALPEAVALLEEMAERELIVSFNQGLDIRLVTPEVAQALKQVHYSNWKNTGRQLYFAFDDMAYEAAVRRGIQVLLEAGIPARYLMFYVLVGFNSTPAEDLERCNILRGYGIHPYVMRFRGQDGEGAFGPFYNALARWANALGGIWKKPFGSYKRESKGGHSPLNEKLFTSRGAE